MKKSSLFVLLILGALSVFGQRDPIYLGIQTTKKGLIEYGNGVPSSTPSGELSYYAYEDTVASKLYIWDFGGAQWIDLESIDSYLDTVIIQGDTVTFDMVGHADIVKQFHRINESFVFIASAPDVGTSAIDITGVSLPGQYEYLFLRNGRVMRYSDDYTVAGNTLTLAREISYEGEVFELKY